MAFTTQTSNVRVFGRPQAFPQVRRSVVPARALNQETEPCTHSWQQKTAAAAAAAVLLLAPAAFAEGTPRKPTLGEERASYAEQLQNAVKGRGQQLQELTDYPTTKEQKGMYDQPFNNTLGAGNSAKDARPLFKLDESTAAPSQKQEGADQLQQALPDFFKPKPQPEPSQTTSSAETSGAASAVQQTAEKLPSPPSDPAAAAKKLAAKVPSPAAVPNPATSAKQAAKKADAGSKSPDPKEAAATRNAQLLIVGVGTLGLTLWFTIERQADPSLRSGGSSPAPASSPSPPASSSNGSAPSKEEDPFFKNVKDRTK